MMVVVSGLDGCDRAVHGGTIISVQREKEGAKDTALGIHSVQSS